MGTLNVTIDDRDLQKSLKKVERLLKNPQQELYKPISTEMFGGTMQAFSKETGPRAGDPLTRPRLKTGKWPKSLRAKSQGGQTLQDKGKLRGSIKPSSTKKAAILSTNVKYAPVHQFGATITAKRGNFLRFKKKKSVTIPARPFLYVSRKTLNLIKDRYLKTIMRKFGVR